jgi:hypothetical protein
MSMYKSSILYLVKLVKAVFFIKKMQRTFAFHFIEKIESLLQSLEAATTNVWKLMDIPGCWQDHPKPFCSSSCPELSLLLDV